MKDKTLLIEPTGPSAAANARAKARVGTVVADRYRVEAVLAANELGAVYRAEHVGMRLRVALKVLHPEAGPEAVARLEREAVAGAHVRHPNVAGASDTGALDDGSHYLVVEHVAGTTLREVLAKGPMPVERAAHIARQLASALEAVHEQGIVHRDLEPRNVMLTGAGGGEVKLIDFGLAKIDLAKFSDREPEPSLTKPGRVLTALGTVVGTAAYLAPEAALGASAVDTRADLYALGVLLYEMLTGRRPFDAEEPAALFAAQRAHEPPPLRERAPDVEVPPELERVVMHLLQRDRQARYPSASAVSLALEAAVRAHRQGAAARATPAARDFAPRAGRRAPAVREALEAASDWLLDRWPALDKRWSALRLPAWSPVVVAAGVPLLVLGVSVAALRGSTPPPAESGSPPARADALTVSAPPASAPLADAGAAPSVAIAAAPADVEGLDAAAWRAALDGAAKGKDWARAGKAVLALVELDAAAFRDPAIASQVASVAAALESAGTPPADEVFHALANRLGTDGLDLLFEITRSRGGTKGAKRAAEILRDLDIVPLEPPALRIAVELAEASCTKKRDLFERAVAEGDQRTLVQLRALRETECDRRARRKHSPCCFQDDPALAKAIKDLRARLGG